LSFYVNFRTKDTFKMDRRQSVGSGLFGTNSMEIPGKDQLH